MQRRRSGCDFGAGAVSKPWRQREDLENLFFKIIFLIKHRIRTAIVLKPISEPTTWQNKEISAAVQLANNHSTIKQTNMTRGIADKSTDYDSGETQSVTDGVFSSILAEVAGDNRTQPSITDAHNQQVPLSINLYACPYDLSCAFS